MKVIAAPSRHARMRMRDRMAVITTAPLARMPIVAAGQVI
jgi:hypothetical protein